MGSNASADLSYGHAYDEGGVFEGMIPDELHDKITEFDDQLAYLMEGLIPPEGDWEDDDYKIVYGEFADKVRAISKACPLEVLHYGDMNYWSAPVLHIRESSVSPYESAFELDELPVKKPEWDEQFAEFFKATGAEPVKLSWIISASYG